MRKGLVTITSLVVLVLVAALAFAGPVKFGVCVRAWPTPTHPATDLFKQARAVGADYVRVLLPWKLVEPNEGTYDWTTLDLMLAEAKEAQVELLPVIAAAPDWALPLKDNTAKFADFIRTLTEHYAGKIKYWQLWTNENLQNYWGSEPNPVSYAKLLRAGFLAAHRGDPKAKVVLGSLWGADLTYLESLYASGAGPYFDIAALNLFTYPRAPEAELAHSGTLSSQLAQMKAVMLAQGDDEKPLWVTSMGWPTSEVATFETLTQLLPPLFSQALYGTDLPPHVKQVAVFHEPALPGAEDRRLEYVKRWLTLAGCRFKVVDTRELSEAAPTDYAIWLFPQGDTFPAALKAPLLRYLQGGGIVAFMFGRPFARLAEQDKKGNWQVYANPDPAGWESMLRFKTSLVPPVEGQMHAEAAPGLNFQLPENKLASPWVLAPQGLKGNDEFVPMLLSYRGTKQLGVQGGYLAYDSDLKGIVAVLLSQVSGGGVSEALQAEYLQRAMVLAYANGASGLFWYELKEPQVAGNAEALHFGLLRSDGTPKPAFKAYQVLTKALRGRHFLKELHLAKGVYGYAFATEDERDVTAVLWTTGEPVQVSVNVSGHQVDVLDSDLQPKSFWRKGDKLSFTADGKLTFLVHAEKVD